jgi:Tat protein secretion system quality control protein TatD with DNase activity
VFRLAVSGADIANRRIGALKLVMRWILGAQSTLQDLIRYVECAGVIPMAHTLSEQMTTAMGEMCTALGIHTPTDLSIRRSGNHVTALLHWRVTLALVSLLEPHQVVSLREMFSLTEDEEKLLPRLPEGFDSHCHLDRMAHMFKMENPSLQEICTRQRVDPRFVVEVSGVVGVFCDPETYPTKDQLLNWCSQGVVPAIGLHPKKDASDAVLRQMRDLLAMPEVVGFGEVGLDRTMPPNTWMDQLMKLEKVLPFLEARHVLILHCRGLTRDADETLTTLLHLLVARGLPTEQGIHLHCFCGTALSVNMWLERFPNTHFEFSLMVEGYDPVQESKLIEGVLRVPSTRLLLETDAPYFRPSGAGRSVPSHIGITASAVAKIRGEKWQDLLATTVKNAKALYRFRSGDA